MQAPRKITIPAHIAYISEDDYNLENIPQATIDAACDYLKLQGASWGDIAHFESAGDFRNTGCFIFDGNTLQDLCSSFDEYGSLPPPFYPIENGLTLGHWQDVIGHNNLIPIKTKTIRDGLTKRPYHGFTAPAGDDAEGVYFAFAYNGTEYVVITEVSEDTDIKELVQHLADLIANGKQEYMCFEHSTDLIEDPFGLANFFYNPQRDHSNEESSD